MKGGQVDLERGEQAEVDQEEQDEQRDAAEEPDVDGHDASQPRPAVHLADRQQQAEREPHGQRPGHDRERDSDPPDDVGQSLYDGFQAAVHGRAPRYA